MTGFVYFVGGIAAGVATTMIIGYSINMIDGGRVAGPFPWDNKNGRPPGVPDPKKDVSIPTVAV